MVFSSSFMTFRKYKHLQKRRTRQPNPSPPPKTQRPWKLKESTVHHSHVPSVLQAFIVPAASLNVYSTSVRQPEQVHVIQ